MALILPARTHPEVIVYAVGARNLDKAKKYAKKHRIEKAYGSYQELLDDKDVDVVYNPLPNALHHEWTMKALAAGKHVLNEKPSANTAEDTASMFDLAEQKGLVMMDAYHYRFHPAVLRVKEIIESKTIGKLKTVTAKLIVPKGITAEGDIRYDFALGGGALMDMGVYTVNCIQYMTSSRSVEVTDATTELYAPKNKPESYASNIDRTATATLTLSDGIKGNLEVDLARPLRYGLIPTLDMSFKAEGVLGSVEIDNYVMPTLYHNITVNIRGGPISTEKVYKNRFGEREEWRTTYMYQLESFVDKVRGREPKAWVSKEDSVATMKCVEKIYQKNGLGSRPKSAYIPV
ncbi:NAD(P)-binding protein [Crepidotus variabilis]|uniref:D-xylose 1-dehydrogenase (NADP(+), D-xylono-1,5-lactone-forming) n=1 Tax=Crepidotus variabilis TaxID=179855 RepID=A0A9P6EA86_9AGAR|nr:NAD(P)-binding protein [Crepidotus variabilis]